MTIYTEHGDGAWLCARPDRLEIPCRRLPPPPLKHTQTLRPQVRVPIQQACDACKIHRRPILVRPLMPCTSPCYGVACSNSPFSPLSSAQPAAIVKTGCNRRRKKSRAGCAIFFGLACPIETLVEACSRRVASCRAREKCKSTRRPEKRPNRHIHETSSSSRLSYQSEVCLTQSSERPSPTGYFCAVPWHHLRHPRYFLRPPGSPPPPQSPSLRYPRTRPTPPPGPKTSS